jgi:hypothetical protein
VFRSIGNFGQLDSGNNGLTNLYVLSFATHAGGDMFAEVVFGKREVPINQKNNG